MLSHTLHTHKLTGERIEGRDPGSQQLAERVKMVAKTWATDKNERRSSKGRGAENETMMDTRTDIEAGGKGNG